MPFERGQQARDKRLRGVSTLVGRGADAAGNHGRESGIDEAWPNPVWLSTSASAARLAAGRCRYPCVEVLRNEQGLTERCAVIP
ncbi:hypothetical protein DSL92_03865 [Billgrantia gudaonensis]|uniref:Uncharacterized protein n=1 Tax=Billgrantia gudaonensis TaxID=376427 RepID=A0A432JJJ6_9GAMM|nr:hypothetical protein DSL92_03865 [Halomonas gudaonensis]